MDLRQSLEYGEYLKSLGWQIEKLGGEQVFIRKIPLLGTLIKIQRIQFPIPFSEIEKLAKKYHAFRVIIEPTSDYKLTVNSYPSDYRPLKSPFIPTKTLIKDIKCSEQEIFDSFSKNKRRDIRIAEKNNLLIKEGSYEDFYQLKKEYLLKKFILPFSTRKEIKLTCDAFKEKAIILVAEYEKKIVAGVLLLFCDKTAYYWQAATTEKGKKLLAPTLIVWEAIKLAKKKGCENFDFEGIYDERFPKNRSWLGFTHFKEGFRGKEIEFPLPLSSFKSPLNIL
ncbi:hypothetical protein COS54_01830 [Candidatus Shapirobacteria bacterium CG03_land_8_20_14_0_80_39_12]|uniref:N-acetyltransferase domain-containing protein n=1 Tax=Candidatus Shapirobacteria bacterium CG03_land_8_20_14_0_80_39_12 TaxID=1974879 RepID=A0A2M7BCZ1_9BACT|nr:MAG: hypothetical protein COS54_01830 [Candidatus Shapirobacteria bacterium CG03_land_8_20_14_0_80_39_12]